MATKHSERSLGSVVIREMQNNASERYCITPANMDITKRERDNS